MGISVLRRHRGILVLTVLAAGIVAWLILLMAGGGGVTTAQAAASHGKSRVQHHVARHHARHASRVGSDPVTTADPDNVQSGDQTTPDPSGTSGTASDTSGESESNVESEQGQPGEPANGHQDAPGQNVAHECTGNCVE
jgi:hypothetical protein